MAVISPNVSSGPYIANGAQTAFPFAFSVVAAGDVAVEIDGAKIAPALYTVAFDDVAGTVTFHNPPASGAHVLILSSPDYLQTSEFDDQSSYSLSTVNTINRRAAIKALTTESKASRAAKAPLGEDGPDIPAAAARADTVAGFGALEDGAPLTGLPITASAVTALSAINAQIVQVADNVAPIGIVAVDLAGADTIGTVAANMANVVKAGSNIGNINAVAGNATNINAVAGNATNINAVASNAANINSVAGSATAINAVYTDLALGAGASFILRAPQAAIDALTAAGNVASVLPRSNSELHLHKRLGSLYENVTSRSVLQPDGRWKTSGAPMDMTWRYPVPASEIGKTVTVYWDVQTSGIAYTIEERSASSQIVAPVTVTAVGNFISRTWTLNASTTELRLRATQGSFTDKFISAPSVTLGRPVTLPSDPDYYARIGGYLTAYNGALISYVAPQTTFAKVDAHTVIVPSSNSLLIAYYGLTAPPSGDFVALVEIVGNLYSPRLLTLTPVGDAGTAGTAINVLQYRFDGSNARFLVKIPATIGSEVTTSLQVLLNNSNGGTVDYGAAEQLTVSVRAYDCASLPALRTVPTVVQTEIEAASVATLASAATASDIAIAEAFQPNIGSNEVTRIIAARNHLVALAEYYVSPDGDDGNAGSAWAPKAGGETALAAATAGRAVLFERNKRHSILGTTSIPTPSNGLHLAGYGFGRDRAWLDSRMPLAGLTWINVGGAVWETTVSFRQQIINNGTGHANSVHFRLYDCRDGSLVGTPFVWKHAGATIADNRSAVAATANSMTINLVGSTNPDPRVGDNGYNFTLRIRMPDDSDPTGADLRISQRAGPIAPVGGSLRDLALIGAGAKDNVDPVPDADRNFTFIENCAFLEGSAHACTGPVETAGNNYYFSRAPDPATSTITRQFILNRSNGGGLELYTGSAFRDLNCQIGGTTFVGNVGNGFYGHTSGIGAGYNDGNIERLRAYNCNVVLSIDGNTDDNQLFSGDLNIERMESGPGYHPLFPNLWLEGSDFAFVVGRLGSGNGTLRIKSGYHKTGIYTAVNNGGFGNLSGQVTLELGENGGFEYTARHKVNDATGTDVQGVNLDKFAGNTLIGNTSAFAADVPIVHFYGVKDLSPVGKKAHLAVSNAGAGPEVHPVYQIELHLHSATKDALGNPCAPIPCVLGDIMLAANGTNYPTKLFVDAGQTFGMGDRNRAQIIAALTAAGKVDGVDFHIDPETWIVNRNDQIIDYPQSIKDALLA